MRYFSTQSIRQSTVPLNKLPIATTTSTTTTTTTTTTVLTKCEMAEMHYDVLHDIVHQTINRPSQQTSNYNKNYYYYNYKYGGSTSFKTTVNTTAAASAPSLTATTTTTMNSSSTRIGPCGYRRPTLTHAARRTSLPPLHNNARPAPKAQHGGCLAALSLSLPVRGAGHRPNPFQEVPEASCVRVELSSRPDVPSGVLMSWFLVLLVNYMTISLHSFVAY